MLFSSFEDCRAFMRDYLVPFWEGWATGLVERRACHIPISQERVCHIPKCHPWIFHTSSQLGPAAAGTRRWRRNARELLPLRCYRQWKYGTISGCFEKGNCGVRRAKNGCLIPTPGRAECTLRGGVVRGRGSNFPTRGFAGRSRCPCRVRLLTRLLKKEFINFNKKV